MKKTVTTFFVLSALFFLSITSGLAVDSLVPDPQNDSRNHLTDKKTEFIHSMGLAPKWEFYLGPMLVIDREGSGTDVGGNVHGGILRYLGNPNLGLGLAGEGYLGAVANDVDSGLRICGVVKFPFLQAGIDHSFRIHETDFILSLVFPVKRGGLFGLGDSLRLDWLPGRDNTFNIGFRVPIGDRFRGKTRNKKDQVSLPAASLSPDVTKPSPMPKLETVLDHVRHSAEWIKIYTTPFFDQNLSKNEDELSEFRAKVMDIKAHINLIDDQYPPRPHLLWRNIGLSPGVAPGLYHRAGSQQIQRARTDGSRANCH